MKIRVLISFSGGLDSTTLLYYYWRKLGYEPECISFNYGSNHNRREIKAAKNICKRLEVKHTIVNLKPVMDCYDKSSSSLLNGSDKIPDGHYAEDNMKSTVVPNRNMIMWSILAGIAESRGIGVIAGASHSGDHYQYPDCRPEFTETLIKAIDLESEGRVKLETPFNNMSKIDIAKLAKELDVPISKTYSCYKGGGYHCNRCGTCIERIEALKGAGYKVKLKKEDKEFYEKTMAERNNKINS